VKKPAAGSAALSRAPSWGLTLQECAKKGGFLEPKPHTFSSLHHLADVLRLAPSAPPWLAPFAMELFRTQTDFNHLVVDVLEDLVWTARRSDHAARVELRLGALASFREDIPRRRSGRAGQLVFVAKRVGVGALRRALAPTMAVRADTNRAIVDALKAIGGRPETTTSIERYRASFEGKHWFGLELWFGAQAEFYEAVTQFVGELGEALTNYSGAFARFGENYGRAVKARWAAPTAKASVVVLIAGEATAACLKSVEGARIIAEPEGDVLLRLPGDEILAPNALETLSEVFASRPEVQLCYGDTFFTDTGIAALKPEWSPEYLLSTNFIGGCFAVRSEFARRHQLGAKAPALSWLLASSLKETEVARVPWVLSIRDRPEVVDADLERRNVEQRLKHVGLSATVEQAGAHRRVRFQVPGAPRVTIVVPFKDKVELLRGLWNSLQSFDAGMPFELMLVSNQSSEPETFEFLERLRDPRVSWFEWNQPFNWSAINNAAAAKSKAELLLFLNNDVAVTHDGWLADLAGYTLHPEIGVVGARLLYEDRSAQHAGVVIGLRGLAGHVFARWRPEYGPTPFGSPELTRNWSAVTGACLMIRRALFEELHGFDERIRISGGDVELCLRVRARGLRVACVGHVELLHYESVSRRGIGVPEEDLRREASAYAELLAKGDPYYHPQLSSEVGHGGLGPLLETPAERAARLKIF
jgi:GT2 family glycosyltransferase